jgi:hypothetical protein
MCLSADFRTLIPPTCRGFAGSELRKRDLSAEINFLADKRGFYHIFRVYRQLGKAVLICFCYKI